MNYYILIDEDFNARWTEVLTQSDIDAVKTGVLEIISVQDKKQLNGVGEWQEMKEWKSNGEWGD